MSSVALISPLSYSESKIIYPMDESFWIYRGDTFNCTLVHTEVPQGKFYFRSNKKDIVSFEYHINNNQPVWEYARVSLLTPPWVQPQQELLVSKTQLNQARHYSFDQHVEPLLESFGNSKWLAVSVGGSDSSRQLTLVLPTIRSKTAWQQFTQCRQRLPQITYREARDTTLHYQPGQQELRDTQRQRLRALMSYVALDKRITHVLIDGHTDNTGLRLTNLSVARKRAEQVAVVLHQLGLEQQKTQVRAHGSRYPVASNDSEQGRAKNRRVVIRLVRDNESVVNSSLHTNNKVKVR